MRKQTTQTLYRKYPDHLPNVYRLFTGYVQIVLASFSFLGYTIWVEIWVLCATGVCMKDLSLLVWLTQLGLSVAFPLAGFILLALWLQERFGWGTWTLWAGIILGSICAIDGFRNSLKAMTQLSKNKKEQEIPPVSFNDHD
jgi:hypothetical protein